jgi:hypothetical protein
MNILLLLAQAFPFTGGRIVYHNKIVLISKPVLQRDFLRFGSLRSPTRSQAGVQTRPTI